MKILILIVSLSIAAFPAFSKGGSGNYFITGKARGSGNEILANKNITVDFNGKSEWVRTDESGNYKITIIWISACPSGLSSEELVKENERLNPKWIKLIYDGSEIKIENQWKNYARMGCNNELEVTRNLDLTQIIH